MHPWRTIQLLNLKPHLHADDGINEEQHGDEEAHIRQRLRKETSAVLIYSRRKKAKLICLRMSLIALWACVCCVYVFMQMIIVRIVLYKWAQTLKDWTKVQSKMRMVSPCLSSLMRRAALNSLRKLRLMKLFYSKGVMEQWQGGGVGD